MPHSLQERRPGTAGPTAQSPGSQGAQRTKPAILHSPWTKVEAGKAQDGKDSPATGRPQAVQISEPHWLQEHLGQCRLGDCSWLHAMS